MNFRDLTRILIGIVLAVGLGALAGCTDEDAATVHHDAAYYRDRWESLFRRYQEATAHVPRA